MKGQIAIPTEFMLNILSFMLLLITILGTFLAVAQYQLTYDSRVEYRLLIDLMENLLSDKCLIYEENGNLWKGVFDESKLDSMQSASDLCVQFHKDFFLKVKDSKEEWKFWGSDPPSSLVEESLSYPIIVKHQDEFVPGYMEVKVLK